MLALLASKPAAKDVDLSFLAILALKNSVGPSTIVPFCENSGTLNFLPWLLKCCFGSRTFRICSNWRSFLSSSVRLVFGRLYQSDPAVAFIAWNMSVTVGQGKLEVIEVDPSVSE